MWQLTLQPKWRAVSTNRDVRCENGDPLKLLYEQIDSKVINWIEGGLNFLIDDVNKRLDNLPFVGGNVIPHFCWEPHPYDEQHCFGGGLSEEDMAFFARCEQPSLAGGLDYLCYYARVSIAYTHSMHAHIHTSPVRSFSGLRDLYQ